MEEKNVLRMPVELVEKATNVEGGGEQVGNWCIPPAVTRLAACIGRFVLALCAIRRILIAWPITEMLFALL